MKQTLIAIVLLHSIIGFGQVRLNEMQSSNSTTINDNFGEYDDWVEIYNPTTDSIEIGGLVLKDQLDTWAIPTGDPSTHLPPNGTFLLWADDNMAQGIFHTNFKLASGGEFLGLYASDSVTVIDSITIPALIQDQSYMRCETGWISSNTPSPLAPNDCSAALNEFQAIDDFFDFTWDETGSLIINILDDYSSTYNFSLYSLDGKKLVEQQLKEKMNNIHLQTAVTGTYFAVLSTDSGAYSKRISILR